MGMLVNRTPVDDHVLRSIRAHCDTLEYVIDTIGAEDLDADGRSILREEDVEGEPADGITLHGTRWGRAWCAFITVD